MAESTITDTDVQNSSLPTTSLGIDEASDAFLTKWTDVEKPSEETETKAKNRFQKKKKRLLKLNLK